MSKSEQEAQVYASKARNRRSVELLKTAVEIRDGGLSDEGVMNTESIEVRRVRFSLTKTAPSSFGIFVDGVFYVRALDAGMMDGRDRNRMLVVAKAVTNDA